MTTIERSPSSTSTKLSARSSSSTFASSTRKQNRAQFAKYYSDLCHIQHSHPLNAIKQNLDKGILDFYGDRIKFEEWWSIINALSCDKTLHFVAIRCRHPQRQAIESADTELKARAVTKQPVVATRFVLLWLTEAIKMCLGQSSTLTVLELEGLPLSGEYLASIARGLVDSKTLQHFSLSKCPIRDEGAEMICHAVKNLPSIISLDLSHCGLTDRGAEIIADLIKYQKLNRYSEAWKQTLRYRDPDVEAMPGLRRITINGNPDLGDDGVNVLAEEVNDDLWLRALDVQDCGLTDAGGQILVELLESNSNLIIVDARGNPYMNEDTLMQIMNQLASNNRDKKDTEYKWINKNPELTKKKFQASTSRPRPWTSQSSVRLAGKAPPPSEHCFGGSSVRSILKRSNTTLNSDALHRKPAKAALQKPSDNEDFKIVENERLRLQLRNLTLILSQEVKHKLALIEENKALKDMLEKKERQKMSANCQNERSQIVDNTLQGFQQTFVNFEKCKKEDANKTEMTTDWELPELVSNLQDILKNSTHLMEKNAHETKAWKRNSDANEKSTTPKTEFNIGIENDINVCGDLKKGDIKSAETFKNEVEPVLEKNRKSQLLKAKAKEEIIWEEDEIRSNSSEPSEVISKGCGKSKAQAMFLKLLETKQTNGDCLGKKKNRKPSKDSAVFNSQSETESSDESDDTSHSTEKFKKVSSSSNEDISS